MNWTWVIIVLISLYLVAKAVVCVRLGKKFFHSNKCRKWSRKLSVWLIRKLTFERQPVGLVYFNKISPHLPENVLIRLFKEDCWFYLKGKGYRVSKNDIIIRTHPDKTEVVFRKPKGFYVPVRNFLREMPSLKKFSNGNRPSSILSHLLNDRAVVYVPNMTAVEDYASYAARG